MTTSTTQPEPVQSDESAPLADEQGTDQPEGPTTKQQAVTLARSQAVTALTQKYRDEFNADIKARVKVMGFDWSPQPTPKEKARAEIERLAREHGIEVGDLSS